MQERKEMPQLHWFDPTPFLSFRIPLAAGAQEWWSAAMHRPHGLTPAATAYAFTANVDERTWAHFEAIDPTMHLFKLEAGCDLRPNPQQLKFYTGIDVRFTEGRARVFIELLGVDRGHQGQGIATALLRNLSSLATTIGASGLSLRASLDAGPWVWLKFGFIPTAEAWHDAKPSIRSKLALLGAIVDDRERARVDAVLSSDNPIAMSFLLLENRLVPSIPRRNYGIQAREVALGFALLVDAGVEWDGTLDFEDEEAMAVFSERVGID